MRFYVIQHKNLFAPKNILLTFAARYRPFWPQNGATCACECNCTLYDEPFGVIGNGYGKGVIAAKLTQC